MPFCNCCSACGSEEDLMVYHVGKYETLVNFMNQLELFSVEEILCCLDILGVDTPSVNVYCKKCYFTFFQELE